MFVHLPGLLRPEQLIAIRGVLETCAYQDGRLTAGLAAGSVKANLQADAEGDENVRRMQLVVINALSASPAVRALVMPVRIQAPLFSRYDPGMAYGPHLDNAVMMTVPPTRADVAVTVALSEPDTYAGGELIMQTAAGERQVRLPPGDAILYPADMVHRVAPVTSGRRLAAVTWIQSMIRDPARRQLLADLLGVTNANLRRDPVSAESRTLLKVHTNLVRMWAET